MDPGDDRRSSAGPLRRCVAEAVLASRLACVDDARDGHEDLFADRSAPRPLSIAKSDLFMAPETVFAARVPDFRTRDDAQFTTPLLSPKTNRSGQNLNTAITMMFCGRARRQHRSYASWGDCEAALGLRATSQRVISSRTSAGLRCSGRRTSHEKRSRGHVRPDRSGRGATPVGAGPGPPRGGGGGGRSRPRHPHLSIRAA